MKKKVELLEIEKILIDYESWLDDNLHLINFTMTDSERIQIYIKSIKEKRESS